MDETKLIDSFMFIIFGLLVCLTVPDLNITFYVGTCSIGWGTGGIVGYLSRPR